jgi:hypothetical protein
VRSGDLFGDLGQGRIARPGILEPIFRDRNGVSPTAPFPNKTRARLEAEAWCQPGPLSARPSPLFVACAGSPC